MATLLLEHNSPDIDSLDDEKPGKIYKEKAFLMVIDKKTPKEISEHFGVTKQAFSQFMQLHGKKIRAFQAFIDDKAGSLELTQFKLNYGLTDKKLRTMPAKDAISSIEKLEKMIRLDRGEATEIKRVEIAFDLSAFR